MSMVNIIRETLDHGADFISLRRISQDVLESFFGHIRSAGGNSFNPNIMEFAQRAHSINFHKSLKKVKGNVLFTE